MNSVSMTPPIGKPDVLDDFLRGREFLDEIRGQAPHVLHLGRMGLDGVLSWADLGSVLETGLFAAKGDLMFTRAREVAPVDLYTRLVPGRDGEEARELVPDRCQELFDDGYTVTVVQMDRRRPEVRSLCRRIERAIGDPVAANAYGVHDEVAAFGPHCDAHEILVLQLDGAKRWRIYGPDLSERLDPKEASSLNQPAVDVSGERCLLDVTLQTGDVLYLPRAWWHEPVAAGGSSLHLTLGLHCVSGAELVRELIDTFAYRGAFREAVSSDAGDTALDSLAERIAETIREHFTGSFVRGVLDRRRLVAVTHASIPLQAAAVAEPTSNGLSSPGATVECAEPGCYQWLAGRPVLRRRSADGQLVVSANGRESTLPAGMEILVDALERDGAIPAGALVGVVGEAAVPFAVASLRRLTALGVVRQTTRNEPAFTRVSDRTTTDTQSIPSPTGEVT